MREHLWRMLLGLWLCAHGGVSVALIGGQLDHENRFAAVVALWVDTGRRCSATKIGERTFLTAAHCVVDVPSGGLAPACQREGHIRLSDQVTARVGETQSLQVVATVLPPAFAAALQRLHAYQQARISDYRARYRGEALARRIRIVRADARITDRFPDAALVRVRETTPDIPVAAVSFTPLKAESEVVLVGYGCEHVRDWRRPDRATRPARRTWGQSEVIRIDAVNFYTFASELRPGRVSLCPGDSGGPVLLDGRVVGIHGTVWGLSPRDTARSNMSVNLHALRDWDGWSKSDVLSQ